MAKDKKELRELIVRLTTQIQHKNIVIAKLHFDIEVLKGERDEQR